MRLRGAASGGDAVMGVREMTYCSVAAVFIAVCSWLSIPAAVVFTMQTFAVFVTLMTLGARLGTVAIAVYLLLGAVGAPVFSGFTGGVARLLGTTGGYLVGFLLMGPTYGLATRALGRSLRAELAASVLALVVLYVFGTAWFMLVYARTTGPVGLWTALSLCVIPFIPFDLLKLALAVTLAERLKRAAVIRLPPARSSR